MGDTEKRARGQRKERRGVVVSKSGDKTIVVEVQRHRRHPLYGKVVRESRRLHAHDERNEAAVGDSVRVVESRPMSRMKRWRLVGLLNASGGEQEAARET